MPHKANPVLSVAGPPRRADRAPARRDPAPRRRRGRSTSAPTAPGTPSGRRCATLLRRTVVAGAQTTELLGGLRVHADRMRGHPGRRPRRRPRRAAQPWPPGRPAAPATSYLGASRRSSRPAGARGASSSTAARAGPTRGDPHDPEHHRRPDDRRPATAPSCRCWCSARRSAPRPPPCGRRCAAGLTDAFDVVAWDLPGPRPQPRRSRTSRSPWPSWPRACCDVVDDVLAERGEVGGPFLYAGDSVGGAVGLQLLLDAARPGRRGRAAVHRREDRRRRRCGPSGSGQVSASGHAGAWWPPPPSAGSARVPRPRARASAPRCCTRCRTPTTRATSQVCGALADVRRARPARRDRRTRARGGRARTTSPPRRRACARSPTACRTAGYVELDGVAHLAPAEAPEAVAGCSASTSSARRRSRGDDRTVARGARRRHGRAPRGARRRARRPGHRRRHRPHRATSRSSSPQYAWGGIWTRPGLDRRSRSLITLTALVARGHHEELAHARARRPHATASRVDEIKELLLQTAIYCGVPDANTAFRIAQQALEHDQESP